MTFYLRKTPNSEPIGPFAAEQIKEMVERKELTCDSSAVTERAFNPSGTNVWLRLSDIPEIQSGTTKERKYLLLILIAIGIMVLIPLAIIVRWAILLNRIQ